MGDQVAGLQSGPVRPAVDLDRRRDTWKAGDTLGSRSACAPGNTEPSEAARPGATTSGQGSRPHRRHRCSDAGRNARHGDGRRADLVRDRLADEDHLDRLPRPGRPAAQARDGHEEVHTAGLAGRRLVVDGEAAATESGEQGLGRAAGQHHRRRGVGGRAAGGQDVGAGLGGGRVASRHARR